MLDLTGLFLCCDDYVDECYDEDGGPTELKDLKLIDSALHPVRDSGTSGDGGAMCSLSPKFMDVDLVVGTHHV